MNKRLLPVLVFALLISGAATFVIYRLLSAKMTTSAKPAQTQLMVAAHELPVGTLIKEVDLKAVDWSGPLPKGHLANVADAANRGVLTTIYEGEPIVENRLATKGAGGGLAATIPVGMRAAAVRVNEVVGVAGFVVPGMRVDVIISGTPPTPNGNNAGTVTKTVLQNIAVLSAGQKFDKSTEGKPETVNVVNLLVTPEQAETLSLASTQAHIQLVLRNPLDTQETKTTGTATANLFSGVPFGQTAAAAPRQAAPRRSKTVEIAAKAENLPITIEVFHGGKRVQADFRTTSMENN